MRPAFDGFDPVAWRFLDGLAADNTKQWFDEHRTVYEDHLATPSKRLVDALVDELPKNVHRGLRGEAKVGRSLFRINRDTRFRTDKTPYKTYLDFLFWIGDGDPRTEPAAIMRLTSATVLLGGGRIGLKGSDVDAYCSSITEPDRSDEIRSVVDELIAAGSSLSEADRTLVPRGSPPNHPNADLLRRDGFHLIHVVGHPPEIGSAAFVGWCTGQLERYAPLLDWLAT
jgi:uncharacterized protein (TIGR02453 family)